jgi:hypothetical protein
MLCFQKMFNNQSTNVRLSARMLYLLYSAQYHSTINGSTCPVFSLSYSRRLISKRSTHERTCAWRSTLNKPHPHFNANSRLRREEQMTKLALGGSLWTISTITEDPGSTHTDKRTRGGDARRLQYELVLDRCHNEIQGDVSPDQMCRLRNS